MITTLMANPPERGARRSLHARLRMAMEAARTIPTVRSAPTSALRRLRGL